MSWFTKLYVYQENVKKHRNRDFKNDDITGLGMNESNTGISFRYNSSGGIKSVLIFTNAKIIGTENPVTTIDSRTYNDEDGSIPPYSSVNLSSQGGNIYGLTTFYSTGETITSTLYTFPTENELKTYLNLPDSEKDSYAQEHSSNYNMVQMGISAWDIYVTNLDTLNRLKKQSIFTIRVDNEKITNDNLNDYDINIYGGFRYSDSTGGDNYVIKKIGGYGISNNLNIWEN